MHLFPATEDRQAFVDTILSLPKLRDFSHPEYFDSGQLGKYVGKATVSKSNLMLQDAPELAAFFTALAQTKATLKTLVIMMEDRYCRFDEPNGHGNFARKLITALQTIVLLYMLYLFLLPPFGNNCPG